MTADHFRKLALDLEGATESSHQGHPDFRAHDRVIATLGWPDDSWGMVKLSKQDQQRLVEQLPEVFVPVKGRWGEQGSTNVRLRPATPDVLKHALRLAWENSSALGAVRRRVRRPGGVAKS